MFIEHFLLSVAILLCLFLIINSKQLLSSVPMSSTSVSSSVRKGVAAAQEVLDQHEVVAFESVHPISGISTSGIKHRGWTFW